MIRSVPWFWLAACQGTESGTFVGNPTLSARLADNEVQIAAGGRLEVLEIHFVDTNDALTQLPATTFVFDGPEAPQRIPTPEGDYAGVFLVGKRFELTFEEAGALTTLIATDFDLTLPGSFSTETGHAYELRLGDEAWLAELAALSEPGETAVESDPTLEQAFFDGLIRGSEVRAGAP